MDLTGTGGNDTLTGTSGDDLFKVYQGGNDTVSGLTGSDVFNFAGTLTAADTIDGGGGQDTVQIKGDYSAGLVFSATTMINIETITMAAGFNYSLTTADATVAAGAVLTLNATALGTTNRLVYFGAAETDGLLHIHGGAGNDIIEMSANMSADDHFDGGDGSDTLLFDGSFNLTFKSLTIHNIDDIDIEAGATTLTFNSGNLLAGQTMEIDAIGVGAGDSQQINAHNLAGNITFDSGPSTVKVTTGSGDDLFNMAGNLTRTDRLDGGTGNDFVLLDGEYNISMASGTLANIDTLKLTAGHTYHLTFGDGIASGAVLTVDANTLASGNSAVLDFSLETLGSVTVTGGAGNDTITGSTTGGDSYDFTKGGTDTLHGGSGGNNAIYMGATLTAADSIAAGTGANDTLFLDGDYTGAHALVFTATTMTGVEFIALDALAATPNSYDITTADATVAAGHTMAVSAFHLSAGHTLHFNGSAETDGHFIVVTGPSADDLTGGALSDVFSYSATGAGITGAVRDTIHAFNFANDEIEFKFITAIDTAVTVGGVNAATIDADLQTAIGASQLGANHAVLFTPNAGNLAGHLFLIVDGNGTAGYQTGSDLVVELQGALNTGSIDKDRFVG